MAKKKVDEAVVSETEQEVIDTGTALAKAKQDLADASQAHADAKAAHDAATAPPKPVLGKQCLIEGSAVPVDLPNPEDGPYPRRFTLKGVNYEHVSEGEGVNEDDTPAVVWVYRSM